MSKAYVQERADLANLAALQAAQVANREYVNASIVMTADGDAHICVDKDHATTPFATIGLQT